MTQPSHARRGDHTRGNSWLAPWLPISLEKPSPLHMPHNESGKSAAVMGAATMQVR
jgi:hypothetical protein